MPTGPASPLRRALAPRHWWIHALALVLVAAAGLLGWWQLQAWQDRRAAEALDLTEATPVPLAAVLGADDPFPADALGRPVGSAGPGFRRHLPGRRPAGRFPGGRRLLGGDADDRAETGSVLPVVRGWVAADGEPPAAPRPVRPTSSRGCSRATRPRRPTRDPADDVLPALRIPDVAQRVDADLYSGYAVALPGQPGTDGLAEAHPSSCRRRRGSRRCATCSTRWSGGSSGCSRRSCGGATSATWPRVTQRSTGAGEADRRGRLRTSSAVPS